MTRALLCLLLLASAQPAVAQASRRQHTGALLDSMRTARDSGRAAEAAVYGERALAALPGHTGLLDMLVHTRCREGNGRGVLWALERLVAAGGGGRPVLGSDTCAFMQSHRRFRELGAQLALTLEPRLRADTLLVVGWPSFSRGIAADVRGTGMPTFYISVGPGGILAARGEPPNMRADVVMSTDGRAQGLAIDARRQLWASLLVRLRPGELGNEQRSELQVFDLATTVLVKRYRSPDDEKPHLFAHVVLARNGDAYVTDSHAGSVYRVPAGARENSTVEPFFAGDSMFSRPQGIALSPGGRRLYVAHFEGLSMWDLPLAGRRALSTAGRGPLVGIDGLHACGNGLIAVQDLPGIDRIMFLELDSAGTRIVRETVLEADPSLAHRVSSGVPVGAWFYFHRRVTIPVAPGRGRSQSILSRVRLPQACQ